MNFNLKQMPERTARPRTNGLTMIMDKGLGLDEVRNFLSTSLPYVDIVKLGFGTSYVTSNLKEKLAIYKEHNVPVYFGGTLFEAFIIRDQFQDYIDALKEYGIDHVEVSDGSMDIDHKEKCKYISELAKHATVIS